MAVRIRLKRTGSRNRQLWRIVVADAKMPRDGRFIEEIGYYNPLPVDEQFVIKQERLDYWLKQGAQLSDSIRGLLRRAKGKAQKAQPA